MSIEELITFSIILLPNLIMLTVALILLPGQLQGKSFKALLKEELGIRTSSQK